MTYTVMYGQPISQCGSSVVVVVVVVLVIIVAVVSVVVVVVVMPDEWQDNSEMCPTSRRS